MKATWRTCGSLPGRRLLARDGEPGRVPQVPLSDGGDAGRHRGREEHRLPLARRRREDRLQVLGEAHVEHLVGLVQHDDADGVELQRAAPDVIQGSPRRRHDDLGAALQGADLLVHGRAAVERDDAEADALRVLVDRLGDLHGQLARGDEHEATRAPPLLAVLGNPLEHRQREGRRLAGARRRLAEHVATRQEDGDRLALDRSRLFVPEGAHSRHEVGNKTERGEVGRLWLWSPRRHVLSWYRDSPGGSVQSPPPVEC